MLLFMVLLIEQASSQSQRKGLQSNGLGAATPPYVPAAFRADDCRKQTKQLLLLVRWWLGMRQAQQRCCCMQQQHEWMQQQLVLRCHRAQVVANAVLRSAQVSSCGGCASQGTQQQQQQQQAQTQQHLPWYNQPHPEQLREVLKLPPFRFQTVIHQEPAILGFQSETLSLTVDALAAALHTTNKAVVGILEERPAMLLTPHEPVKVLHQLADLLQRRSEEAAFLLSPYPQLLALSPQQLQQRIDALAAVMQWPTEEQELRQVTAAAGVSFLQLLVAPVQRTQQQLEALATALGASQAACGKHHACNSCVCRRACLCLCICAHSSKYMHMITAVCACCVAVPRSQHCICYLLL
jgi:hypothetical protein